ncbi:hypothetical protein AMPC_21750 [Anaeromyxobacter paludicola]|uniref:Uncharacterized protein n=1 Tax=Anaeromyxobacter paludicola TaxID=2918171 RepID=A0ABM7XB36_9BACT|nr:hypothetical protein AMPC_21750 [Anaeromyxobacter paludicola]
MRPLRIPDRLGRRPTHFLTALVGTAAVVLALLA